MQQQPHFQRQRPFAVFFSPRSLSTEYRNEINKRKKKVENKQVFSISKFRFFSFFFSLLLPHTYAVGVGRYLVFANTTNVFYRILTAKFRNENQKETNAKFVRVSALWLYLSHTPLHRYVMPSHTLCGTLAIGNNRRRRRENVPWVCEENANRFQRWHSADRWTVESAQKFSFLIDLSAAQITLPRQSLRCDVSFVTTNFWPYQWLCVVEYILSFLITPFDHIIISTFIFFSPTSVHYYLVWVRACVCRPCPK